MNYIRHLNAFFSFVRSDNRLTSSHVSLYVALFQYWNFNRFENPFPVYRENIMQISKIGSKNTYHKCIKELHQARYIIHYPSPSKFLPVKISMLRLDVKEEKTGYEQLDLFTEETNEKPSPKSGTNSVPNLTDTCPNIDTRTVPNLTDSGPKNDTDTVPNLGHIIKLNSKHKNSVLNTPTEIFEKNRELHDKVNELAGVPKLRHCHPELVEGLGGESACPERSRREGPTITEVENFFRKNKYPVTEAYKFFYYNQGKNWMFTEKLAITNWKALAHKWMINTENKKEETMDPDHAIQYIYERFLDGERITKLVLPEFAQHLQLEITQPIKQEALRRRLNQLSGSNENAHIKLWQAYMNEQWQNTLVIADEANLRALEHRLAVLKHFQKLKIKGQQNVFPH
jgi:hypothetical protein